MKRVSIRWRMKVISTTAFAVVLITFGIFVYSLFRQTHNDQIDRVLVSRYREVIADDRPRGLVRASYGNEPPGSVTIAVNMLHDAVKGGRELSRSRPR